MRKAHASMPVGKPSHARFGAVRARKDPNILALEERLKNYFKTRVTVVGNGRKGQVRISFLSLDEFDRILEIMGA